MSNLHYSTGTSSRVHVICCQRSVDLEVSRSGAVLPASQGLNDSRAAQRACPLPVEPQTQALLAEDVLRMKIMYTYNFHRREVVQPAGLSSMCGRHIIQGLDPPCSYEHCSVTDSNPLTHHFLYQIMIVGVYKRKCRYAIL